MKATSTRLTRYVFTVTLLLGYSAALHAQQGQGGSTQGSGAQMQEPPRIEGIGRHGSEWRPFLRKTVDLARRHRRPSPPDIVPQGWIDDFDYEQDLRSYLEMRYERARERGKEAYVYVYADWWTQCREFRRTVSFRPYAELFADREIILIDFAYLQSLEATHLRSLPVLIKVHHQGTMGPEAIQPVTRLETHPMKTYYTMKNFFEDSAETG